MRSVNLPIYMGIMGMVYYDYDGDNEYNINIGDESINQAVVNLYSLSLGGDLVETIYTDIDGRYNFNGVVAGTYYLEVNPKDLDGDTPKKIMRITCILLGPSTHLRFIMME
jgi:hypothetical protein